MKKYANNIMIQGTASSSGKSILTAALCRIFNNDGYKVSPFKSQNMSLNSGVIKGGFEMSRAQIVQAAAARAEPDINMNPILLKPVSDKGSQVVINGKAFKNMTAQIYFKFKPRLKKIIKEAYGKLALENDIIVIEGAGSPAEINLKKNDFVNMGMAKISRAPVVIVGDIDKGGVFAAFYGTVKLLTPSERKYVKGFIINKFRGDKKLLLSGLKQIEKLTGVPVLGVVPYIKNLDIEDEDGFAAERLQPALKNKLINISVIKLPHMSNFTDFNSLSLYPFAGVNYVEKPDDLKNSDIIIIPGSKNTIYDLIFLKKSGFADAVLKEYKTGKLIFGICGGYQMMGGKIYNPLQKDSAVKEIEGLGLLDAQTVFLNRKITVKFDGLSSKKMGGFFAGCGNKRIKGYEIHKGKTTPGKSSLPLIEKKGDILGVTNKNGTAAGVYIHGIFDNSEFTAGILKNILILKGKKNQIKAVDYSVHQQKQYDILANIVRANVDIKKIYRILNEGIKDKTLAKK